MIFRVRDFLIRKMFRLWQRLGITVLPNHFYSPVPDIASLERAWPAESSLIGIDMREDTELALLARSSADYKTEYDAFPRTPVSGAPYRYHLVNGAYESVDAEILHCMIRAYKPKRIFEIGSGYSTRVSAEALLKNGDGGELVAFEPYPHLVLRAGFPGLTRLVQKKIQDVPLETFDALEANDILFIDSSHAASTGSDVVREYLEIIPRLKPGVLVHIHDIFLPRDYPKDWVLKEHRFWNEQYLLQAFLAFNANFEVLWAGQYMHMRHPEALTAAFASYDPATVSPGSFWIRRVR